MIALPALEMSGGGGRVSPAWGCSFPMASFASGLRWPQGRVPHVCGRGGPAVLRRGQADLLVQGEVSVRGGRGRTG